jgi:predicted CoA-binding protein
MDDVVRPEDAELRVLLGEVETIAVVGLSADPARPSHHVATYLRDHGYTIVPVNPSLDTWHGNRVYGSLLDIPPDIRVDVVDVFRRSEHTPDIARDAVAIGAKVLWLQEGIVSQEAMDIATDAGLDVIMGVCLQHVRQRLMEETAT